MAVPKDSANSIAENALTCRRTSVINGQVVRHYFKQNQLIDKQILIDQLHVLLKKLGKSIDVSAYYALAKKEVPLHEERWSQFFHTASIPDFDIRVSSNENIKQLTHKDVMLYVRAATAA